ncbi:MAG TPA: topoisomerase II, partial [Actinoplanes sp.]|nr:topoisomerase II [Actinoplanes sp.]
AKRYADVLAVDEPLDSAARRAKQGLIGRQLTLR